MNRPRPATCRACGERFEWALTVACQWLAINPRPDPAGNQAVYRDAAGTRRTRQLAAGQEPYGYERRYMPHAATCKPRTSAPSLVPSRAPLPDNVIPFRPRRPA